MSQPYTSTSYRRIQVGAAIALGALVVIAILLNWRNNAALDERGRPAAAQVVYVSTRGHWATVRFTSADGRTITTTTSNGELVDPPPAVGSTIPIIYDSDNPQAKVRDPRASRDSPMSSVVVAGAGVALLGALVVQFVRRRTRADDAGRRPGDAKS